MGCHCKGNIQWTIKEENEMTFACSEVTLMPYLVKPEIANLGGRLSFKKNDPYNPIPLGY